MYKLIALYLVTMSAELVIKTSGWKNDHYHRLYPHETDCAKFYLGSNKHRILRQCPSGLFFNVDIQVCDWPENVKCKADPTSTEDIPDDAKTTTDDDESTASDFTTDPSSTIDDETTVVSTTVDDETTVTDTVRNECPSDIHLHVLLEHETDCSLFYQCSHGTKILRQCSIGTLFDVKLQVCNWPDKVTCRQLATEPVATTTEMDTSATVSTSNTGNTSSINSTITQTTVTPLTTTAHYSTTKSNPTTDDIYFVTDGTDVISTNETDSEENYTDEENTTLVVTSTFPSNLTVITIVLDTDTTNKISTVTDSNLTSAGVSDTEITVTDKPTSTIETSTLPNTTETHVSPTTQITTECDKTTDTEAYDSTTAYMTLGVDSTTTTEPTSTDESTTDTETDSETSETTEQYSTSTSRPDAIMSCPPGFFGIFPHPDRCDQFFVCTGGMALPQFCRYGYEFDPHTMVCAPIRPGGCTLGTTSNIPQTTSVKPTVKTTTKGVGATENVSHTVSTDVNATVNGSTEKTPVSTEPDSLTTKVDYTTVDFPDSPEDGNVTATTYDDSESTTTTVNPNAPCPPGFFGTVPDPKRCDSFFMCIGGMVLPQFCKDGDEYDSELKECVLISEGGCTDRKESNQALTVNTNVISKVELNTIHYI